MSSIVVKFGGIAPVLKFGPTTALVVGVQGPEGGGGGGGGSSAWGDITGTLSAQTDLQAALDLKLAATHAGTGGSAHADAVAAGAAGFMTGADKSKLDGIAAGATANATDAQLRDRSTHTGTQAQSTIVDLVTDLAAKAPLASPALTGTPTAPTAAASTNTTQLATTAFVQQELSAAVTGLLDLKGSLDASTNPNYPAASKGDTYFITVAGKVGGASGKSVDIGDAVIANADNAGGDEAAVGTSWIVLEHNLAGALLATNNLSDVANAATARTNLGLGNVDNTSDSSKPISSATQAALDTKQPLDATLTALAALTIAGNSLTIGTGADTFTQVAFGVNSFPARASTGDLEAKTISDFALTLLDDADASAMRTTLGITSGATLGANTFTATQTITPAANTNALAVTGYSLTGSNAQSMIDLAGTWNTSGTPTAISLNITDTASNAASLLLDLRVGGVSKFSVSKAGNLTISNLSIAGATGAITTSHNFTGSSVTAAFSWAGVAQFSNTFSGLNTGTLFSFKKYVIAEPTTRSLTNRTQYVVTNEGATSKPTLTLVTAVAGDNYDFVVKDADGMRIVANSGDTIRVIDNVTAAAGYIESTTIGSSVRLIAINSTEWIATNIHGVWTDGTFTYDDTSLITP